MVRRLFSFLFCTHGQQSFLFGSPCTLEIVLDDIENRKHIDIQTDNATEKLPLYIGNESVKGVAKVIPKEGKKLEHQGIVLELIGQIGKNPWCLQ